MEVCMIRKNRKIGAIILALLWITIGCATQPSPTPGPRANVSSGPEALDTAPTDPKADKGKPAGVSNAPANTSPTAAPAAKTRSSRSGTVQGAFGQKTDTRSPQGKHPPDLGDRLLFAADGEPDDGEAMERQSSASGTIEFNFDNAELNEVIRTLADILEIQYLAEPDLQGKVTIHTTGGMSREDLFPVFFKILEVNGLTAVKDGPIYRISSVKNASRLPLGFKSKSLHSAGLPPEEQVIIQVIPLRNISPTEMTKILVPFASEGATIVAHEGSKTLLVVDKKANIQKIIRMVQAFDLNLFSRVSHRFYFLENANAKETSDVLREIFGSTKEQAASTRFLAIERLNAVLTVSTDPAIFDKVDQMMFQLDAAGKGTEPRIYVYFVKNGTADELADLLNRVFTGQALSTPASAGNGPDNPAFGFSRNPFPRKPKTPRTTTQDQPQTAPAAAPGESSTSLRSAVNIIPDPIRNALIIEATPNDYKIVENILTRIDILPRQVLIEATIAEITLGDLTDLGIEWEYARGTDFDGTELVNATINGTSGLTYSIEFAADILHRLSAKAEKDEVNILSSPHVLASDNKEAKIDVSSEIPIVSSETTVTSGAEPIITTDIQYRDTGVLLSVTPHINERGLVTMDIYQEVSEVADNVEVAGVLYPSFFKRAVDTTLTVRHGQTIVLGGLIRENKSHNRDGVPLLMDIPVLGVLFGSRRDNRDKTELIILLTPRVIDSLDDVAAVTEEFENKVIDVMQTMRPQS